MKKINLKEKSNLKTPLRVLKIALMFSIISWSAFGVYMFFENYELRAPVVFQNPIVKKSNDIVSPVGTKSASLIPQVEAREIENPYDPKSPKGVAWELNKERFGHEHWESLDLLIEKESSWNPYAVNSSSGACGIPQSLPCKKMKCELWDYECQLDWMTNYIEDRYGDPVKALTFHYKNNWY